MEGSTPQGPRLSRDVHGGTDLVEGLVDQLEARYAKFFEDMGVDPVTCLLKGTGGVEDRVLPPCRNEVRLRPGGKPRPRLRSERRVRHESRRNLDDRRMAGRAGASGEGSDSFQPLT